MNNDPSDSPSTVRSFWLGVLTTGLIIAFTLLGKLLPLPCRWCRQSRLVPEELLISTRERQWIVAEDDMSIPVLDVAPNAVRIDSRETYDSLETLSRTELESLGFFSSGSQPPGPPTLTDGGMAITSSENAQSISDYPADEEQYDESATEDPNEDSTGTDIGEQESPTDDPTDTPVADPADVPQQTQRENEECNCQWAYHIGFDPDLDLDSYSSEIGEGKSLSRGPLHVMWDQFSGDCLDEDGNTTPLQGELSIFSKVICSPEGCCEPKGTTFSMSMYKSDVRAVTRTRWCWPFSVFSNAVAADVVEFSVNSEKIANGSGAIVAPSGANMQASVSLGIGGTGGGTQEGHQFSGTGTVTATATQVKADGPNRDKMTKFGEKEVSAVDVRSELKSGGKTQANITGRAAATAEATVYVAGIGHIAKATNCVEEPFYAFFAPGTSGPEGRAAREKFFERFERTKEFYLT